MWIVLPVKLVEIRINGVPQRVPVNQPLAALLEYLEIASDRVAVELNRNLVRKRDWGLTIVSAGAELEIVEFVGGG
jgi:sulfur carrier protein